MGNLRRGDGDLGTEGDLLEYGDLRLDIEGAILGECFRGETERLGEAERRDDLCLEGDGERLLGEIDRCLPRGDRDVLLGLRCSRLFVLELCFKSSSFSFSASTLGLFKAEPSESP